MILGDESFDVVDEDCLWTDEPAELLGDRKVADGTYRAASPCRVQVTVHSDRLYGVRDAQNQQGQSGVGPLITLWTLNLSVGTWRNSLDMSSIDVPVAGRTSS